MGKGGHSGGGGGGGGHSGGGGGHHGGGHHHHHGGGGGGGGGGVSYWGFLVSFLDCTYCIATCCDLGYTATHYNDMSIRELVDHAKRTLVLDFLSAFVVVFILFSPSEISDLVHTHAFPHKWMRCVDVVTGVTTLAFLVQATVTLQTSKMPVSLANQIYADSLKVRSKARHTRRLVYDDGVPGTRRLARRL